MIVLPALLALLAQGKSGEVTVYNGGFGLIKEVRVLNLKAGRQDVDIDDVAQFIETDSIGIRSLTKPDSFQVLEQNFQNDTISVPSLLTKAVGQKIRFHRVLPNGTKEVVEGVLISLPGQAGGLVIRKPDGSILLNPSGEIELASIPSGMRLRPTLNWLLDSSQVGRNEVELTYLTQGMSWQSDYVLTLGANGTADLAGWVTVDNRSGKTYKDVQLNLMAGEVNRAPRQEIRSYYKTEELDRPKNGAMAQIVQENLFEYHLYRVQRPASLRSNEQKQISLLRGNGLKYEKKLIVDSMLNFGMYYPSEGEIGTGDIKPLAKVEFLNTEANKLGMPLPKGRVRVYQRDATGAVQMVGEDAIDHTPKGERLSLTIGRSFDVRATRKRTDFKRIDDRSFSETFEIEVRNRKTTPERVYVYERHYSEWEIPKTSMKFDKLDSQTMQYIVDLKANESKTVTYTVITRW